MKSKSACIIASIFLFLLISGIIANSIYTKNTAERIISGLDTAAGNIEKLDELCEYWAKRRKILNLSHSEPELDRITSLLDELTVYARSGNTEEYERTTACIKHAVENIKEIEEFSIKNIF